jgi:hypothetical protein
MMRSVLESTQREIAVVMGADCPVRFKYVADIPLSASGKYPYILRRSRAPNVPAPAIRELQVSRASAAR